MAVIQIWILSVSVAGRPTVKNVDFLDKIIIEWFAAKMPCNYQWKSEMEPDKLLNSILAHIKVKNKWASWNNEKTYININTKKNQNNIERNPPMLMVKP